VQLEHKHIGVFCDNTSAVSWAHKLRTSKSIVAGRLLRMIGMRIHARKASSLTPLNIAGEDNEMADIVSRAFKNGQYFEAGKNLTSYFNSKFPLPQKKSWTEFHIPSALASRVTSCLRGELLPMASLLRLPQLAQSTGVTGAAMYPFSTATPSSLAKTPWIASTSSVALLPESEQEHLDEDIQSRFRGAQRRLQPSTRPSNWLENRLPSTRRSKNIN
jgi:hypothetical protein